MTPLIVRKIAAASGLAKRTRSLCSSKMPGDADRHRGDGEHEQESVVRVGVGFVEVPERRDAGLGDGGQLSTEPAKQRDPRRAIVDEESEGGAHVEPDDEGEEERLRLRLGVDQVVPTEESGQQDAVAEARDREEFGDALRESHDDGLEIRSGTRAPLNAKRQRRWSR